MPVCKKCGFENREDHKYCVNCGTEIEPSPQELTAKVAKKTAEKEQKAFYLLFIFLMFAFIDIVVAHDSPPILFGGLLMDAIICAFLWFTWLGR